MGKITLRFYLNKRLKPIMSEDKKKYPLYTEVIYKRQRTQFKAKLNFEIIDPKYGKLINEYYCEEEFDQLINDPVSILAKEVKQQKIVVSVIINLLEGGLKEVNINAIPDMINLLMKSFSNEVNNWVYDQFLDYLDINPEGEICNDLKIVFNWDRSHSFSNKIDILKKILSKESSYFQVISNFDNPVPANFFDTFYPDYVEKFCEHQDYERQYWDLSISHVLFRQDENYFISFINLKFPHLVGEDTIHNNEDLLAGFLNLYRVLQREYIMKIYEMNDQ